MKDIEDGFFNIHDSISHICKEIDIHQRYTRARLNKENYLFFAIRHYDNLAASGMDDFLEDMKRFEYVRSLIERYVNGGTLEYNLIISHILYLNSIFGKGMIPLMFYYIASENWPIVKTFLHYLDKIPDNHKIGTPGNIAWMERKRKDGTLDGKVTGPYDGDDFYLLPMDHELLAKLNKQWDKKTSFFGISGAKYNHEDGTLVLTTDTSEFSVGDKARLNPKSLVFSCSKDNFESYHMYPRVKDPAFDAWLDVLEVTPTSITVNVGVAKGGEYEHKFVKAIGYCLQKAFV